MVLVLAGCSEDDERAAKPSTPEAQSAADAATTDSPNRDGSGRDAGGSAAEAGSASAPAREAGAAVAEEDLTFRNEVPPVKSVAEAMPRVFIPPYQDCREPKPGETGRGPNGKVCTTVMISGATEEGKYFPDYADCNVVITQRPFWSAPPTRTAAADDPRLNDSAYLRELEWVRQQIAATGCVCCHDSKSLGKQASQWDISLGPLWLDSLSDNGLALFAGFADSSVLGAYKPEDNNGFDRNVVGVPTTDNERMGRFMRSELTRRGISEAAARAVPPFGGPIYENRVAKPRRCVAGEGVDKDGFVRWKGGAARYVYVMNEGSDNPGVPPNLDLPEGTLYRLDVLASKPAIESGLKYGTTPAGTFQAFPNDARAPDLERGKTYQVYVLLDVGISLANCTFQFGSDLPGDVAERDPVLMPMADAGAPATAVPGGSCASGGDARGYGAPCKAQMDCSCEANYCALMPGQSEGYCTTTECTMASKACPSGWSCFDLSRFAPGQPAICTR